MVKIMRKLIKQMILRRSHLHLKLATTIIKELKTKSVNMQKNGGKKMRTNGLLSGIYGMKFIVKIKIYL